MVIANHNTQSSGDWNNNNTWVGNSPPTNPNNTTININTDHGVILNGNFDPNNNVVLHIWGYLEITGNVTVNNNFDVTVYPGGTFIVGGDFSAKNNAEFTINGEMAVEGDLEVGQNTILGGNGTIYVGGEHNLPDGSNVEIIDGFLPISLLSFEVKELKGKIQINWSTATEINNDYFTLERSIDGSNWEILAYVDGAGNSNQRLNYEYIDDYPYHGISYYRLKQTDFDGKFEYFAPVAVNFINTSGDCEIGRVTSHGFGMNVWFRNQDPGAIITVSDIYGRILYSGNAPVSDISGELSIDFPRNYSGEIIVMRLQGQQNYDEKKIRIRQ
jgi:hypothetical protein